MPKYQEGMTEETALAEALARYIEQRSAWRLMQDGDLGSSGARPRDKRTAPDRASGLRVA
jgi:hypothetical protein